MRLRLRCQLYAHMFPRTNLFYIWRDGPAEGACLVAKRITYAPVR